jgi:hypothetical protein
MAILFTQNFDIIQGSEEDYGKFISAYIPETTAMGLSSVGGYYVEVGFGGRIVAVQSAKDLGEMARIIETKRFKEITLGLKSVVCNYRNSVLEPLGRAKKELYSLQTGVWKLNQYYDLRPGMKQKYADFIMKEHIPAIAKMDYVEVTGGWDVVLGGWSEIMAEYTFRDPVDIGRLLNNEDFRKLTLKLRSGYVANYQSRILRCTERFDEPKWFKL